MAQAMADSGGGGTPSAEGGGGGGGFMQYAQFAQGFLGKNKQEQTAMERRMSRPIKTPLEAMEEVKAR